MSKQPNNSMFSSSPDLALGRNALGQARFMAYITQAATLLTMLALGWMDQGFLLLVMLLLVIPLVFRILQNRTSLQTNSPWLLVIDAIIFGSFLALYAQSTSAAMLMLILANASFVVAGDLKRYSLSLILFLSSLLLSYSLLSTFDWYQLGQQASPIVDLVAAIGVGVYIALTSFHSVRDAQQLLKAQELMQEQAKEHRELSRKIAKYLSPQVWQTIFTGKKDVKLENQRKKLVVFFSDIKGFTELSEIMEPEQLTTILNEYLNIMSRIALKHGGTIDKFIGDAIMIFFGDPDTKGAKKDAEACVSMALEMRRTMRKLFIKWRADGIQHPLEIRMGINTGYCTVGNFGAETRMDYTIIGKEVNLASRLESAAEPGEILVSHETHALIKDLILCREKPAIQAKGFSRPVPVYSVVDFRRDLGARKTFTAIDMEGFTLQLDVERIRNYDLDRIKTALEQARETVNRTLL